MGTTLERKGSGALLPQQSGAPAHETISDPEQRVELHEMPDLTKEAPEVEYGQPKRSWLRYLAVGVTVGAVAVGGGLLISSTIGTDAGFTYGSEYSMAREHLAQTPGGFPLVTAAAQSYRAASTLEMEHLAQTPGGFPTATVTGAAQRVPGHGARRADAWWVPDRDCGGAAERVLRVTRPQTRDVRRLSVAAPSSANTAAKPSTIWA